MMYMEAPSRKPQWANGVVLECNVLLSIKATACVALKPIFYFSISYGMPTNYHSSLFNIDLPGFATWAFMVIFDSGLCILGLIG
jgi:hypothetical protein